MKKNELMNHLRMFIVDILGCIALILICVEPAEDETWFRVFLITKGLAFLIGYITYVLYVHWESKGLLPKMDDECR